MTLCHCFFSKTPNVVTFTFKVTSVDWSVTTRLVKWKRDATQGALKLAAQWRLLLLLMLKLILQTVDQKELRKCQ